VRWCTAGASRCCCERDVAGCCAVSTCRHPAPRGHMTVVAARTRSRVSWREVMAPPPGMCCGRLVGCPTPQWTCIAATETPGTPGPQPLPGVSWQGSHLPTGAPVSSPVGGWERDVPEAERLASGTSRLPDQSSFKEYRMPTHHPPPRPWRTATPAGRRHHADRAWFGVRRRADREPGSVSAVVSVRVSVTVSRVRRVTRSPA
jgi:hypothetical protein